MFRMRRKVSATIKEHSQNSTENFDNGTKRQYALSPEAQRAYDESVQKTLTALPNDRITFKDVITKKQPIGALTEQIKSASRNFTEGWRIATTNAQAGLERVLTEVGESDATAITNYVRAGKNASAAQSGTEGNFRTVNTVLVQGGQNGIYLAKLFDDDYGN